MDYEKEIISMKEALEENVGCGYAKNLIRLDILKDGRRVKVQLLIEIEPQWHPE